MSYTIFTTLAYYRSCIFLFSCQHNMLFSQRGGNLIQLSTHNIIANLKLSVRWDRAVKYSLPARCFAGTGLTLMLHACCIQSSGRTFDCNRFHQAVDYIILDFILLASLHFGWPAPQHGCYWLTRPIPTPTATATTNHTTTTNQPNPTPACLQPSLDWMTQKISGRLLL